MAELEVLHCVLVASQAVKAPYRLAERKWRWTWPKRLPSTFISQLCKLLTQEGQHRLALDGEGRHRLASPGPRIVHLSLFLQSGLCLWGEEASGEPDLAPSLRLSGSSGCPTASTKILRSFSDVSFHFSSPGSHFRSLDSL